MYSIWQVFIGGVIGTTLRYIIGFIVPTLWMLFIVNVIGSFLLGILSNFYEQKQTNKFKLFFTTGLLGSFTTFSSFSEQWLVLLKKHFVLGFCYGITMMVLCLLSAFIGYKSLR